MDTDNIISVGEAHCEDASTYLAKAVVPRLAGTVRQVFRDDALRVNERKLRQREGHAVLLVVLVVFVSVPVEPGLRHLRRLARIWHDRHTDVWLKRASVLATSNGFVFQLRGPALRCPPSRPRARDGASTLPQRRGPACGDASAKKWRVLVIFIRFSGHFARHVPSIRTLGLDLRMIRQLHRLNLELQRIAMNLLRTGFKNTHRGLLT